MVHFTDLVEDVILNIIEHLEHECDLNSLSRTSRWLHQTLDHQLYSRNVRFHKSWALAWAADNNRVDLTKRLLAAGADPMARMDDTEDLPAIVVAAERGNVAIAKLLCETGV
ncbi:ankyrin repeat domain-containing protein [Candidatus Bathyarchaeota archaeon]|nr:ankyrin repeat domain-containing protein [Candidatus Bathyarchaeota archaeon]